MNATAARAINTKIPHSADTEAFSKVRPASETGSAPILLPTDEKKYIPAPINKIPRTSVITIAFVLGFLKVIKIRKKAITRITMLRSTEQDRKA